MNLAPRQQYGLGSLVKSVKNAVSGAAKGVKSFVKSDIGKMALLAAGGFYAGGGSLFGAQRAGMSGFQFGNLPGANFFSGIGKSNVAQQALGGPKYNLGGFGAIGADKGMSGLTKGLIGGGALTALMGAAQAGDQEAVAATRDIGALRGYLSSYYENLGYKEEEIPGMVDRDTAEYSSAKGGYASGGRVKYQIGGDVAYDATDSIYGSSAATFTPDTVMDAFGNQVQSELGNNFNKPPNRVNDMMANDPRFQVNGGITGIPAAGGLKATEIDMPIAGGNNNQMGILPVMPQEDNSFITQPGFPDSNGDGIDDRLSDEEKERRLNPVGGGKLEEAQYNNPLPKDQLMSGFEQYKKNNPVGGGTQALVPVTLPNGENFTFTNGGDAGAFAQYLQSIGQPPYQDAAPRIGQIKFANGGRIGAMYGGRMKLEEGTLDPRIREIVIDLMDNEGFEFGEAVKEAYKIVEQRANGGRIGYAAGTKPSAEENTPSQEIISRQIKQIQQMVKMGSDVDTIKQITGASDELIKEILGQAKGGRIGYAFGSDEIVDQASGIMGLPKRTNNAGVKELDLRDSGGFIPPVGVKEKADDVPAMLSNNEFVFTADAVRGMGNGDVNEGAQRMYDMMKKLENGGRV